MGNGIYPTLNRQSGLLSEMQVVAQNIANMSTTGYRSEGVVFAEHVASTGARTPSLSLADAAVRSTDARQGAMRLTGGTFDLAIEGPGYFTVETEEGMRLTRAGAFLASPDGLLSAPDGARLLDEGGAPIFVPPDAVSVSVGADGTLSADGIPLSRIAVVEPEDPLALTRAEGVRFDAGGATRPVEEARVLQGHLEGSNVDTVRQIARMIEVQRAYELGQSFLEREDERVRQTVRTTGE